MSTLRLLIAVLACSTIVSGCGKDAERQLIGTWVTYLSINGTEVDSYVEFKRDHNVVKHYVTAAGTEEESGTWQLSENKLAMVDKDKQSSVGEIVSVDDKTLVVRDRDTTLTFNRHTTQIPDHVAKVVGRASYQFDTASDAKTQGGEKNAATERPAPPAPTPNAPASQTLSRVLDDYRLVPTGQHIEYALNVEWPMAVRVVLDIEEQVPLDVVVLPKGKRSYDDIQAQISNGEADELIDMLGKVFGEDTSKFKIGGPTFKRSDLFRHSLSRQSAYRHYEATADLPVGQYMLVLDNSTDRGDASAHIQIFEGQ